MTTSSDDFEAAKTVADRLKGMEKERQERILRWVAESLSLDLGASRRVMPATAEPRPAAAPTATGPPTSAQTRQVDIKTFVDAKRPKSDVQFAAVVAYYYRFEAPPEARQDTIDSKVLQDAARLAGRRRPPKPLATLNNSKALGYLDSTERGQFRISSVGENLVAMTLPGTEREERRPRAARAMKRPRPKPRTR